MNKEKGIEIKKVRCFYKTREPINIRQHRDLSDKDYKQQYHVENNGNYIMAIYEDCSYLILNNIEAASYYRRSKFISKSRTIVPSENNGEKLKYILKSGTRVLLLQHDNETVRLSNNQS